MHILNQQLKRDETCGLILKKISVLILSDGDDLKVMETLQTLRQQINTNFSFSIYNYAKIVEIEKSELLQAGRYKSSSVLLESKLKKDIQSQINKIEDEYILFTHAGVQFLPRSLLSLGKLLEEKECDAAYCDEYLLDGNVKGKELFFPKYQDSFFQNTGIFPVNILWKKQFLEFVLQNEIIDDVFSLTRQLFCSSQYNHCKIVHVSQLLFSYYSNLQKNNLKISYSNRNNLDSRTVFSRKMYIILVSDRKSAKRLVSEIKLIDDESRIVLLIPEELEKQFLGKRDKNVQYVFSKRKNILSEVKSLLEKNFLVYCMKDSVSFSKDFCEKKIVDCFDDDSVFAVSPSICDENLGVVYAGAATKGISRYYPILSGAYIKDERYDYLICSMRDVAVLSEDFFCVRSDILIEYAGKPFAFSNLTELAVDLSLNQRKNGGKALYQGQCRVQKARNSSSCDLWGQETGQHLIRWEKQYGDLLTVYEHSEEWLDLKENYLGFHRYTNFSIPEMLFTENKTKKILVVAHEMSLTGAPVVLNTALLLLRKAGYDILVVSISDGLSRNALTDAGISVVIDPLILEYKHWGNIVKGFDLVFVNTIVPHGIIACLSGMNTPVLWWIHDAAEGYKNYLEHILPSTVGENIHIFCGGEYAQKVLHHYRPKYPSQVLLYGIKGQFAEINEKYDMLNKKERVVFAVVGSIENRKGQDIFVQAIEKLSSTVRDNSLFLFVGAVFNEGIFNSIENLIKKYPDTVQYIPRIPRSQMISFYEQIDCLVCASRDDPMPVFVVEGMMLSCVVICSENTGTASLIENRKNGFVYKNNSSEELSRHISYVVEEKDKDLWGSMKREARRTILSSFSEEKFRDSILSIVGRLTENK